MRFANWLAVVGAMGLCTAGALGAQGCTVTTGVVEGDDSGIPQADASPGADTSVPLATACGSCLIQGCRGQWSVCAANAECLATYNCTQAADPSNPQVVCASNPACVQHCYDSHPNGNFAYNAIADCDNQGLCTTCQTACGVPASSCVVPDAGSAPDAAPPPDASTPQSCDTCVNTSCSAEKQACAPQTDCDLYTQCLYACADQACLDKCGTDHATGKAASGALGACTTTKCGAECGLK